MAGREEIFQKAMSLGHSAAWDQQWNKAAEAYQEALAEIPEHPKALSNLGLALFELQRYDESLKVYQKAAQAAPNDPVPLEKVGQLSERIGMRQEAIRSYLSAAEMFIKSQEADKALSNWVRVTQLDPEQLSAHSYLAMVHERLGHGQQAATEYLTVAGLLQRSGNVDKASEMVGRALHLVPNNPEARQAQSMIKEGQLLPKPMQPRGGTGILRMAQVEQLESPKNTDTSLDPIEETLKRTLARLAEIVFDFSDGSRIIQTPRRGMQAIVRGTGELDQKQNDHNKIVLFIGQAIDAQTKNNETQAADELEKALEAGFADPAIYFDLGLLRSKSDRLESALRALQIAVKHPDYALAARLLLAQIEHQMGRLPDAVTDYLEALKIADAMVVAPDQAVGIRQLYEPLIEAQAHQTDTASMEQLCTNIKELLLKPNWRSGMLEAREQLPKPAEGTPPMPLAEILAQAQSSQIIDAITRVRSLARAGHLRSAMDEAYESFKITPTYLPLHSLIGDLLIQEGRTQDAIAKYAVVAQAYSVRGEATQAVNLLRRIVQVAPMEMAVRTRLIDQLAAHGMVDEAVGEYIDLADIYYRLAELDMARKTYTTALHLAQQGGANRAWSVKLLRRMVDIDMQRLDWRQALRIFEQLRTLEPDDATIRKSLVEIHIRLNQYSLAAVEMDGFREHLQNSGRGGEMISFLEDLVKEDPRQGIFRRALAEGYRQEKRIPEAIAQLDALGSLLLKAGDRDAAIETIETIMALNPPGMERYKGLLVKLRSEQ